ncbi:hypothetical protein COBT_003658 [Conglomerata obtusa]
MKLELNNSNKFDHKFEINIQNTTVFGINCSFESLNQILLCMCNTLTDNDWSIEIFDHVQAFAQYKFVHPKEVIEGKFSKLKPWKKWTIDNTELIRTNLGLELFIKFSHNKFGYETKFFFQSFNGDMANRHIYIKTELNLKLAKECKKFFISNYSGNLSKYIEVFENNVSYRIYFKELISSCFENQYKNVHDMLLVQPCLCFRYFQNELIKYIINELREKYICRKEAFELYQFAAYSFLLTENFDEYEIQNNEIIERKLRCSNYLFERMCEILKLTETDKKFFDDIIKTFCSFYEKLNFEFNKRKKYYVGSFKISLDFKTHVPAYLHNNLSQVFKKYLGIDIIN